MPDPAPRGLFCPSCRGVRLSVVCTKSPAPGLKIRYRKCTTCNHHFKTREVATTPRPPQTKTN